VLSRLAWARQRLRARLMSRGVALSAAVAAAAAERGEAGGLPARWVTATVGAALPFAAGERAGFDPTRPAALAEGVLRAMLTTKLRVGAVLVAGLLATGAGLLLPALSADKPDAPPPSEPSGVVTVTKPVRREVAQFEDFTGRIEASVTVEIRSRLTGTLVKVAVRPGAEVKRGDLLFELDPRSYQAELDKAQAELHRAEAQLQRAEREWELNRIAQQSRSVSESDVLRSKAAREEGVAGIQVAKAGLERARLDLDSTRIIAPIDGRIGRVQQDEGNLVGPTTVLTTIVGTNRVYAVFDIDERTYLRLRKSLQAKPTGGGPSCPVRMGLADEQDFPHQGSLEYVDNRADPATGTIRARAVFPNPNGELIPGLFARVRLVLGETRPVLLIPEKAVGTAEGRQFVLVVSGNNTVEWRAVALGPAEGGLRVVREGLGPDDRIIISGLANVRPGAPVQVREAESKP
jgi:RND family efflux transporter MFP subunit